MGIPVWGQRVGKWRLSRFKCGLIKHVIFNYHVNFKIVHLINFDEFNSLKLASSE